MVCYSTLRRTNERSDRVRRPGDHQRRRHWLGRKWAFRPAHRFLAFDKKTVSATVWFNSKLKPLPEDTTYSTPVTTVLNVARPLPRLRFRRWQRLRLATTNRKADLELPAFTPRAECLAGRGWRKSVYGPRRRECQRQRHDGRHRGHRRRKDRRRDQDWENWGAVAGCMLGKSSPVLADGRLYAFDDGAKLYVIDVATGRQIGKPVKMVGTIMRSSPVYADGKIYALHHQLPITCFQPTKDGAKLVFKLRLPAEDEVSGSPIISHGRIYVPTGAKMYLCLGKAGRQASRHAALPAVAEEAPAEPNDPPVTAQIVPVEVLLKPGMEQAFTVKLYNARGRFLGKESPAGFTLTGPGEINRQGHFLAANAPGHTASILTAKVGDSGKAASQDSRRPRDLPWKFDFSDGQVPVTWVAARLLSAHRPRRGRQQGDGQGHHDSERNPQPGDHGTQRPAGIDYTIQADVKGALTNNKLPDAGVIAQRYTLDLMGASQRLQIRSWSPQLERFSKSVPFAWNASTWYTIKFRAAAENGKAVLKGKVWKRGEPEPPQWTIEAVDEAPNLVGSPGLWGNANDSEITIDNILVTKNTPK